MDVISRKEAKEKGLTKYFTGKPCKHGHTVYRYIGNKQCSKCAYKSTDSVKQAERIRKHYSRRNKSNWAYNLFDKARKRARKKGIPFNIVVDDIIIGEKCPILNIPYEIGDGVVCNASPSLDRIDPAKGYIRGNIQVLSYRANVLKSNATIDEIELILTHLKNINI